MCPEAWEDWGLSYIVVGKPLVEFSLSVRLANTEVFRV